MPTPAEATTLPIVGLAWKAVDADLIATGGKP
jgi:hypothetical protein